MCECSCRSMYRPWCCPARGLRSQPSRGSCGNWRSVRPARSFIRTSGTASAIRVGDNGNYLKVNHQRTRTLGLRLRRTQRPAGHVQTLIEAGWLDGVLDLSGVTSADSTVVGEIASTHTTLHRRGGRLTLLNPSKGMSLLLSISRLASVIEIRPTAGSTQLGIRTAPAHSPALSLLKGLPRCLRQRRNARPCRSSSRAPARIP